MADATPEAPFGGERPDNFIIGVISNLQEMESAVDELRSSGYSEDSITVLHGEDGADALRRRGEQPGGSNLLRRILIRFDELARGATDNVQRHIEAAEEGHYVVGVILPDCDDDPNEEVRQILKSHGGRDIVLVGRYATELLDP